MSRRPRIPEAAKRVIFKMACEKLQEHPKLLVEDVKARIENLVSWMPEDETIQKYIVEARKKQGPEDAPWSLATLNDYHIPPEALPAVLRVWKMHLTERLDFTIRQAKWVARLQGLIIDITDLSYWATTYAFREYYYDILHKSHDSRDLDTTLAMGRWELATACWMGKASRMLAPNLGTWDAELGWGVRFPGFGDLTNRETATIVEHGFLDDLEREISLPDLGGLDLSEEAEWVYAHWLVYLRDGPKCKSLSKKERQSIILRLREWIRSHPWGASKIPSVEAGTEGLYGFFQPDFQEVAAKPQFKPTELLKEVGYEVEQEKEEQDEGTPS